MDENNDNSKSKVESRRATQGEFGQTLPFVKKTVERSTGTDFFRQEEDKGQEFKGSFQHITPKLK